jgi:hypothetical protein
LPTDNRYFILRKLDILLDFGVMRIEHAALGKFLQGICILTAVIVSLSDLEKSPRRADLGVRDPAPAHQEERRTEDQYVGSFSA